MKTAWPLILTLALAGCSSYPVVDGGDGVYYASSPPSYVYVDSYVGFDYSGPYAWTWYDPVWYSPLAGGHYYWNWSTANAPLVSGNDKSRQRSLLPGTPVMPGQLAIVPVESRAVIKSRFHENPRGKYRATYKPPGRNAPRQASSGMRRPMAPSSSSRKIIPSSIPRDSEHEH